MKTILEAKNFLRANFEEGVKCPCCDQLVKMYKRKVGNVMARMLIRLSKLSRLKGEWHHVKDIAKDVHYTGSADFAKLSYWGLIEERPNNDKRKRTSGYWRITPDGEKFVFNKLKIKEYAMIYDSKCYGFSNEEITIVDSLGKHFDYEELMSDHPALLSEEVTPTYRELPFNFKR